MANPLRNFLFGTTQTRTELVEALTPRRSFADVIVPESTRRALDYALNQIRKHDLIFARWGLAERHATGKGLAFNFAGPPGTGKTICAEAIAHELGKKLLVVRYAEMESLWAGETGKNVAAVFHSAREQDAVLFFDEADAIAGRRFANVTQGYQREANTVVNVLLKELEDFDGVVIFATNLAANFDPAFERRVRTHILFEMPGAPERALIWRVQLSPRTPLAPDVDFKVLGEKYAVSGGDIKNAVLKAAQIATTEPVPDAEKKIFQRHFEQGMQDVVASKKVMEQSIFDGDGSHQSTLGADAMRAMSGMNGAWGDLSKNQESLEEQLDEVAQRLAETERQVYALPSIVERFDDAARTAQNALRGEVIGQVETFETRLKEIGGRMVEVGAQIEAVGGRIDDFDTRNREHGEQLRGEVQKELQSTLVTLRGELSAIDVRWNERIQAVDGAIVRERDALKTNLERRDAELVENVSGQITRGLQALQSTLTQGQQDLELTLRKRTSLAIGLGGGALLAALIALVKAFAG